MNRKIGILILTIVACVIVIVTILFLLMPPVPPSPPVEKVGLDHNYMRDVTVNLSYMVHDAYGVDDIRKGRAFGTKGDNATANYIKNEMEKIGLEEIDKLRLAPISGKPDWKYSNKVETIDYQLKINHPDYPFPKKVPKNETFVFPSALKPLDHNYTFDGVRALPKDDFPHLESLSNTRYNISCEPVDTNFILIGNAIYISSNEPIPSKQDGMVFLIGEEEGCESKLSNITNATGIILIHGTYYANISNCCPPIVRVSHNDSSLTEVIDLLENGTTMIASNVEDNETLTFELFDVPLITSLGWPSYPYMVLVGIPEYETNPWDTMKWVYTDSIIRRFLTPNCKGYILYDKHEDTHFMGFTTRTWKYFSYDQSHQIPMQCPGLPVFSVNKTIGDFLEEYADDPNCNITGSYLEQKFTVEKYSSREPGVEAYNVEGKIYSDRHPDEIIVISNRYDGWWGETPGDSGAGAGIVLGIAKYFTDHNITPKYNLTFLFTTGEEYGMRGAHHYRDSHPYENFKLWIGMDQLGFDQKNTTLGIYSRDSPTRKIVEAIANQTNYERRNNYNYSINSTLSKSGGAEDAVWQGRCDTICFVKDTNRSWERYHRAGKDYEEGDSLKYTDWNDLNVTLELAWNITKYFCVDPNCWFGDVSYETVDSPNDRDTLPDSIRANFSINTSIPQDKVMVKIILYKHLDDAISQGVYGSVNYTITSPGKQESLTISIPGGITEGNYSITLQLYNSTGRINEILNISFNNYNDTDTSDIFHLYHCFGYNKPGSCIQSVENRITGSVFTIHEDGIADNITAYIPTMIQIPPGAPKYKCMIYRANDSRLIGTTEEWFLDKMAVSSTETSGEIEGPEFSSKWVTFTFSNPKPILVKDTKYVLTIWGDNSNAKLYYDDFDYPRGYSDEELYGIPPSYADFTKENKIYSIYCNYTPD